MSIKAKQVAGVTTLVVLVVAGMTAVQMASLTRVRIEETASRAAQLKDAILHRTGEVVRAGHSDPYLALREEAAPSGIRIYDANEAAHHFDDLVLPPGHALLCAATAGPTDLAACDRDLITSAVLAEGGSAIEAMLAMAATIAVVYPHMNGIGGDGFWLVREASGKVTGIEACGYAGSGATVARYRQKGLDAIPARGPDAALTVPGAVGGWIVAAAMARALGGRLSPRHLLADAIRRAGTTDGPALRDAIAATRDFAGATGVTTLDENRNAKKPAVIITVKDGEVRYVETISP